MSDIRVVLLLLALVPAVGLAQSPAPPLVEVEDARREEAGGPVVPTAREAEAEVKAKANPPVPLGGRVFVETLVGGLAGVGGTLVGVLGTGLAGGLDSSCAGPNCKHTLLVGGALVGFSLGAASGVYFSGSKLGGQGRLAPTLGLSLLSGLGGTLLYASDTVGDGAVPLLALLPLVSSIAAYELSGAWASPAEGTPAPGTGAWWTPTVGVSGRGASLGLTGRF
ncbi:MAG TPA: hypothetical protein VE153_28370 [Myxococcus sp.]|nr:hypothetical protein [Myxococcus sp.]